MSLSIALISCFSLARINTFSSIASLVSYTTIPSYLPSLPSHGWPGIESGLPRWEAGDWKPQPWHGLSSSLLPGQSIRDVLEKLVLLCGSHLRVNNQARTLRWGCRSTALTKMEIKHRFCRHDDIKRFTRFALQPKSATEIGWLEFSKVK